MLWSLWCVVVCAAALFFVATGDYHDDGHDHGGADTAHRDGPGCIGMTTPIDELQRPNKGRAAFAYLSESSTDILLRGRTVRVDFGDGNLALNVAIQYASEHGVIHRVYVRAWPGVRKPNGEPQQTWLPISRGDRR